jgi:large subunit ribosomal protein L9
MEVILLEKIRNLGDIGAKISVKPGHARNYLIPYGKAVVANEGNLVKFAKMRAELEKNAAEALKLAEERKEKLEVAVVTVAVKATEEGKLFGSVSTSNISHALKDAGFDVKRSEISMPKGAIRQVGEYEITLLLHSDVTAKIKVNVVAAAE